MEDHVDNVERLRKAGCVAQDAKLSDAELAVINGLSDQEVEVLIGIRKKLDDELAKSGTSVALGGPEEGAPELTPNFIV